MDEYVGPFSLRRFPLRAQIQPPPRRRKIVASVEAHGGKREPAIRNRSFVMEGAHIRKAKLYGKTVFVGKVIPFDSFIPGLATVEAEDLSPASNFTLRIPLISQITTQAVATDPDLNDLISLGKEVMRQVKELDIEGGLDYVKEETSRPEPSLRREDFYKVVELSEGNFNDLDARVLHPIENIGEGLRPSGLPTRQSADGHHAFTYYGIFIYAVIDGGLPVTCTLIANDHHLRAQRQATVGAKRREYPIYKPENDLQDYNIIAFKNRKDVEERIGVCNGFLHFNEITMETTVIGPANLWHDYRHDINGPIQILRRAIYDEQITHIESAILLTSLNYDELILFDEACNCPEDLPEKLEVIDSQHAAFEEAPFPHELVRVFKDDQWDLFDDLRILRINTRKHTMAAEAAESKAAAAEAVAAAAEAVAAAAAHIRDAEGVKDAANKAEAAFTQADTANREAAVAAQEAKTVSTPNAKDPVVVKLIQRADNAAGNAATSKRNAEQSRDNTANLLQQQPPQIDRPADALERHINRIRGTQKNPQNSSSGIVKPKGPNGAKGPNGGGGGGGSAKKHSRKRARLRTQKQKRYISRNNKQIKKYAKRHTMRNKRRNTRYKYSSL